VVMVPVPVNRDPFARVARPRGTGVAEFLPKDITPRRIGAPGLHIVGSVRCV